MGARDVSRREFVRGAGGVVVGGVVATTGFSRLGGGLVAAAPTAMTRTSLGALVGQRFQLWGAPLKSLDLFKVRELRFAPAAEDSFSLLFRGPATQDLAQGVYTIEHRRTGKFTVLVVPMRPEPDARYYEVIFNRAMPR